MQIMIISFEIINIEATVTHEVLLLRDAIRNVPYILTRRGIFLCTNFEMNRSRLRTTAPTGGSEVNKYLNVQIIKAYVKSLRI